MTTANLRPTNRSLPPGKPATFVLEVAPPVSAGNGRKPCRIGFAIDRSGSMKNGRLELAKEALASSLRSLSSEDRVNVVAFDDRIEDLGGTLRPDEADVLEAHLATLTPRGMTNIHGALARCYSHVAANGHVFVLTDGHHNDDATGEDAFRNLAARAAKAGVTTSTIGIGEGFQETLLQAIASAGGGRCEYLRYDAEIPHAVADSVAASQALVGSDAQVTISSNDGFSLCILDLRARQLTETTWQVPLGSLRAGWVNRLAIVASPIGPIEGPTAPVRVSVTYLDVATGKTMRLDAESAVNYTNGQSLHADGEDLDTSVRFEVLASAYASLTARRNRDGGRRMEALRIWQARLAELQSRPESVRNHPLVKDDIDDLQEKVRSTGKESPEETKRTYFKDAATLSGDDEKARKYRAYKGQVGKESRIELLRVMRNAPHSVALGDLAAGARIAVAEACDVIRGLLDGGFVRQYPAPEVEWNDPRARYHTVPARRPEIDALLGAGR